MRVVVVGGGLGGCAAAARLAKLGHSVTLLERSAVLGGAIGRVEADGFAWDSGPASTLLPAVIRDLFRKSGRPADREFDLVPLDPVREHRWPDGSRLRLPGGSRAAQLTAVDNLAPGGGAAWTSYVDSLGDVWEEVRRGYLERPRDPAHDTRDLRRLLGSRLSLERRLAKALPDPRLRDVAAHSLVAGGHDPRRVPAWAGVPAYLEQRFGAWTIPGGFGGLAEILAARLRTRRVTVEAGVAVRDLVVRHGRCVAVATAGGEVDADAVVVGTDPRALPALAALAPRARAVRPPAVTHLGLSDGAPGVAPEVVLHGDPLLVVQAPAGSSAWTVHAHGPLPADSRARRARRPRSRPPAPRRGPRGPVAGTRSSPRPAGRPTAWPGRAGGPSPPASARGPRSGVCTPPAPTLPRAQASLTSASPPHSSPRSSARPADHLPPTGHSSPRDPGRPGTYVDEVVDPGARSGGFWWPQVPGRADSGGRKCPVGIRRAAR